jgi:hypothetical protein
MFQQNLEKYPVTIVVFEYLFKQIEELVLLYRLFENR